MIVAIVSTIANTLFAAACVTNIICALWLLNTRWQHAAITFRLGAMTLAAACAMAALGVLCVPERLLYPSDLVMQLGLSLQFGLLARQTRQDLDHA